MITYQAQIFELRDIIIKLCEDKGITTEYLGKEDGLDINFGKCEGFKLIQIKLTFENGISFELDLRGTPTNLDIKQDAKNREFSVNSIYFIYKENTPHFFFINNVSKLRL